MRRLTVLWVILLAVVLVAGMSLPAGAQGGKTIKIGVIGLMKFVQGIGHWNVALMAA